MIIDDVAAQANSLLIHHPDAITDFKKLSLTTYVTIIKGKGTLVHYR